MLTSKGTHKRAHYGTHAVSGSKRGPEGRQGSAAKMVDRQSASEPGEVTVRQGAKRAPLTLAERRQRAWSGRY